MRIAAAVLVLCAAREVAANPMPASAFEGRGFFDIQLGLGPSFADDLDFATAWSIAAGIRFLPRTYAFARLRHTSPFYKILLYDLLADEIFDLDTVEPGVDTERTHETDIAAGLRFRWCRVWVEGAIAGGVVYRIGNQDFDTQTHLMFDSAIGLQFTSPQSGTDEHFDGMFFLATSFTTEGDLMKALVGMSITVEVM